MINTNVRMDRQTEINMPKTDLLGKQWTRGEIKDLFDLPLLDLVYKAATVHRTFHDPQYIQQCSLLSIKTGGCSEDCSYCPQSARYETSVKPENLMTKEAVFAAALNAKQNGSSRFCMGAAWSRVKDNDDFAQILNMVSAVRALDMEVCCTLGMLTEKQAGELKTAGLTAYNHNLDVGQEFYDKIISTRTFQDRLDTLENVRNAGIDVCCGGIVGMGESAEDRIDLIYTLANLPTHPESVPINALVPVPGTPLASMPRPKIWEVVRMVAAARITMPTAKVRLSAGRNEMSDSEQAICFLAGANSIFSGSKLLTTANPSIDEDASLLAVLGLNTQR
jgi:biotin synthase